jgi:hypothetical protein
MYLSQIDHMSRIKRIKFQEGKPFERLQQLSEHEGMRACSKTVAKYWGED